MKFILLLTVLLINSALFAKELTVLVLDGWKSKPVANCEVTLKSIIGQVLFQVETDAQGKVVFSDLSYGKYTVITTDIGNDFEGSEYELKLKEDTEIKLFLRPTNEYKREQMALEDSIHGEFDHFKKKESKVEIESDGESESEDEDEGQDTVYIDAEFPGGDLAMKRFIQENVMYPEISRELGDQGRIYVVFVVEPDGVVTHVSIFRGVTSELDEEGKRLVRSMPTWTPGTFGGEKVRALCRLPITFTLQ